MTTGSIGRGTVIASRYRLEDLLTDSDGARFWRATDTVLARSVAVHAVPSTDPRAALLLEAARVSATVTDAHLLRVLDCDEADGIAWVVNEWGDGVSLDLMLHQGVLPPARAAWLTREVADAIAAGHARGVAHGRLNPESVLVTHAGAVKLIGFVVHASLEPPRAPDPLYGELDDREADVIDLAGILYAALTGRWPGVTRSEVPPAPREARRPLRPRQVRAGVPRTLDAICDRVLHKEASQHALPIETAHEIGAALADFVGDPGAAAPLDLTAMHVEPTVAIPRGDLTPSPWGAGAAVGAASAADAALDDTGEIGTGRDTGPDTGLDTGLDTGDLEATQLAPAVVPTADPHPEARSEPAPPPPPFDDLPERPLFAETERRAPRGAPVGAAAYGRAGGSAVTSTGMRALGETGTGPGPGGGQPTGGFWPFDEEPDEPHEQHTGREGRGWLRTAIVVTVLLLVVVAMVVAFSRGRHDAGTARGGGSSSGAPSPSASASSDSPVPVSSARDFDPPPGDGSENPQLVKNVIDGNPATTWMTSTYYGNPALGGLKPGVGVMLDLGRDRTAGSVTILFKGSPTDVSVYAAPAGVTAEPTALDQLDRVGSLAGAGTTATITFSKATTTRYLLVWLTRLPAVAGGYRGEIAEITVRS